MSNLTSGFSPASTLQSNLPQSTVIFYDKKFVANLKANTPFIRCTERRPLPMNSGNQLRLYMYQPFAANTNQTTEGTVGSGITTSVTPTTATIGQYADYVSFSDLALETAIDPALENIQKELAYRLALSLSTIVRNTADTANSTDNSVNVELAYNAVLSRTNIVAAVQALAGRNVQPFDTASNHYGGIIHPFAIGDVLNDTANNGLTDILKRYSEGQQLLKELPGEEDVPVMDISGVRFYSSSIVTQSASYAGHAGVTALRTYIFGENGVISVSLGVKEDAQVGDGDWRNLKIWLKKLDEPTSADPSRVIGGFTSYNVKFAATLPPDTTMRIRCIDAPSGVS